VRPRSQALEALQRQLASAGYIAEPGAAAALLLMRDLGRPLLLEGDAGVGKTELAKALAQILGTRLIRLQCYEGLDAQSAMYEWNYRRQLLATCAQLCSAPPPSAKPIDAPVVTFATRGTGEAAATIATVRKRRRVWVRLSRRRAAATDSASLARAARRGIDRIRVLTSDPPSGPVAMQTRPRGAKIHALPTSGAPSMNTRRVVSSAFASAVALGLIGAAADAAAQERRKEACYGIAKKGQNDCSNLSGTHSCAGQSKVDFDPGEWRYVPKGSCKKLKGMTADEVKAPAAYGDKPAKTGY